MDQFDVIANQPIVIDNVRLIFFTHLWRTQNCFQTAIVSSFLFTNRGWLSNFG